MKKQLLITIFDEMVLSKKGKITEHPEIQEYLKQGYKIKSFQQSLADSSPIKIAITLLLTLPEGKNSSGGPDEDTQ